MLHWNVKPLEDRVLQSIVVCPTTACWRWAGEIHRKGYGLLRIQRDGVSKWKFAHRVSYELFRGKIPDGLVIDHLCRVRDCVNLMHLEVVTQQENTRRGFPGVKTGLNRKTHCPQGHIYSGDNLYEHGGRRHCKTCRRLANQRWLEKQHANAL